MSFVRVAFPVPLRQTFLYSVPDELVSAAVPGAAVRCPFGARERRGFVVERAAQADRAGIKPIAGAAGDGVVFAPDLLRLCLWIADYYLAPIGRVLMGALPGGLEGFEGSRARKGARAGDGRVAEAAGAGGGEAGRARVTPTAAQAAASRALADALGASAFAAFLLHGVTGSGKTEVYLEAAEVCRRARRQTLLLVPEIALSHQLVHAFRARFGDRVGVLHSSLSVGERRANWERARAGRLDVVVGARSAVFAPLSALGLVVVDEEHDAAYKQSEHIRYHGRDTAVVRARLSNAVAVLGSATPSLESFANAERGKYRLLTLPERVDRRPLPVVEIVDLNEVKAEPGGGAGAGAAARAGAAGLFTAPLLDGLASALARGDQALVFLNRRGHTRVVECEDCGFVARCPACDVSLTYHSSDESFRCHYCGRREPAQGACPKCESPFFRHKGSGTQKAEKELVRCFPSARVLRLDSDSAQPRGAHAAILGAFARGDADVLLGTQMIAKGFDFHRVTFVGVVSADHSLHLPDFRATERTFQQIVQVAGRAGRGARAGRVVVQTRAPEHPALTCAAQHDFAGFARAELAVRQEFGYPPFGRLIALALSGKEEERVVEAAMRAVEALGEAKAGYEHAARARGAAVEGALDVLGPAPSPLARLRGRHRWRITLKDRDLKRLHAVCRGALDALEAGRGRLPPAVLLSVDVDPYDVL